jgi:hypothetical protein
LVTLEGIIDLLGRATAGSPIEPAR